ncbi:hypothetical protein GBF38_011369, partial [Nibea albiflora]
MAKSSGRKSLKSLFSRSEASLVAPVEKDVDKSEEEKKRFKFLKLKLKSKNSSASEKPANENQQVISAVETENRVADNNISDSKKSILYGTAPRSKGKEFSYSELDLRKPKRFATFSFGLRKRKQKYEEDISKSTFGLHSPGIDEHEETHLHRSQMELDQANTKTMFSMSQPQLDMRKFDIPSPPPVNTNQLGAYFSVLNESQSSVAKNAQPEAEEPLTNGTDLVSVHKEPLNAPIATIPELQLESPGSSEEKENISVHENFSRRDPSSPVSTTVSGTATAVPILPTSHPSIVPDIPDHKAADTDSACPSNVLCDNDILQQSSTKTEISLSESTRVALLHHQAYAFDTADSTTLNGKPCLETVDSRNDAINKKSAPVPRTDNSSLSADSPSVHQEVSISRIERSVPQTAESVTTAPAVSSEKSTRPVNQDAVYGALYESLFPQSFTSEVMSSVSNPPPQVRTEILHHNTKSEPVMVKTLNECHTETNVLYSRLSNSREFDSAAARMDEAGAGAYTNTFSERKVISSSESSSSYQTAPDREPDIQHRYLLSSLISGSEPDDSSNVSYSELTQSLSEVKSDSFSLVQDSIRSVPVVQSSAPPVSDCVTSRGTDAQVTDTTRRVILVKELVTDEANSDPGCPSLVPEKMSALTSLEIETVAPGQTDGYDGPLSPTYLSVGSDDGSAMEIYYSAEEDNIMSGDEEMYTVCEREEICAVGDVVKMDVRLREELPWQEDVAERRISKRDEGGLVIIVRTQNEGVKMGNEEDKVDVNTRTEVQQQLKGQSSEAEVQEAGMFDFHIRSDAKEKASAAFPQEERKEELLATPVQQVNTLMVCDFAPPSTELHVQGEGTGGNWNKELETEAHPNQGKQLLSQEIQYLAYKDIQSSECIHAASGNTTMITPKFPRETEEQVAFTADADKRGEVSTETSCMTTAGAEREVFTGTLTHSSELQSDATEIEHNRAPRGSEWVDTITQSTETTLQQVPVELSVPITHTCCPDTEVADTLSERGDHLQLNQGSLTASRTPTTASEANQESVDKMNSGYSILSTRLSIKNSSPPKEDESKYRFRKVSLIGEAGTSEVSQDTVDFSTTNTTETESNGEDLGSEYKWRNRFEGVSQYKPYGTEDSSFSGSLTYRTSDIYSSTSPLPSSVQPEAATCKYLDNTFSSASSSPAPEKHITLGNRLSDRTEVYLSRESEPAEERKDEWRRSLVQQEEPTAPAGEREQQREGEAERIKSHWETHRPPVSSLSSAQRTSYDSTDSSKEEEDDSHFTGVFQATLVELVSDSVASPSTPPASPDTDFPNQFDMDSLVDTLKSMGPS